MKKIIALLILTALALGALAACGSVKSEGVGRTDVVRPADVDPSLTAEPEPIKVQKRLTFAAAGDNIIYQAGFTDARNRATGGREFDFTGNYVNIKEAISSADLSFINQETLVAGAEYGYSDYPRFNSPREVVYDLIDTGFDVIGIANNHMLDMGTDGLGDTIAFYKTLSDVTMIGGYDSEQDFMTPRVVECDGIRIAFLAFTYATNGLSRAAGSDIYVPYIDDADIERAVAAATEVSDLVFVSMHWGNENNFTPTEEQRHAAQLCADLGVDVIIGQHPHVIQPVEWIDGKDGNRMLCIFSLGDFIAVMMRASNMLGGIATFDIVQDGDVFTIENPVFEPTVFHFGPSYYNGCIYWLRDFDDSLASTFGNVYGITADKDDMVNIVTEVIDAEFLPEWITGAPAATEG